MRLAELEFRFKPKIKSGSEPVNIFRQSNVYLPAISTSISVLCTHQRMTQYDIPRRVLRQLFPYLFYGPFELLVYLHGQGLFVDLDREGFGGFGGFEAEFLRGPFRGYQSEWDGKSWNGLSVR